MKLTIATVSSKLDREIVQKGNEWLWSIHVYGQPDFTIANEITFHLGKDKAKAQQKVTKLKQCLIRGDIDKYTKIAVLYESADKIKYICPVFKTTWCDVENGLKLCSFADVKDKINELSFAL